MVPKSIPQSATSERQTSQTLVPGMLGPRPSQFPCPRPSPLLSNGPQVTPGHLHIQMFSLAPPFVGTLPICRSGTPRWDPPSHSSSSRLAATKTRRRGTCALGTGAMLTAELGMLSRLGRSG